jgi:hypothetical protein
MDQGDSGARVRTYVTIHNLYRYGLVVPMERASVATDGDSRTAMDGPDCKQSCPLEWVPQVFTEHLRKYYQNSFSQAQPQSLRQSHPPASGCGPVRHVQGN